MRPYSIMALSFHGRILNGELGLPELCRGLARVGIEGLEPATGLFTARPDLAAELPAVARDAGL
ncbi:MAG: hypothetical protein HUU35_14595, partial [Armatimonadetes bacterium]|nr:hypothetical protein [Armatimonadota bacterium]